MSVRIHIHQQMQVQCISLTIQIGIARYDSNNGMELGVPHGIKTETGDFLDMDSTINATLKDDMHVWVVLGGTCADIFAFKN